MPIKIGNLTLKSRVYVPPMAGGIKTAGHDQFTNMIAELVPNYIDSGKCAISYRPAQIAYGYCRNLG